MLLINSVFKKDENSEKFLKINFVSGVMLLAGRAVGGSNCEALPDMSLFHNLKLKRRKVDSRGSSDGKHNTDRNVKIMTFRAQQIVEIPLMYLRIGCPVFMNILIVLT